MSDTRHTVLGTNGVLLRVLTALANYFCDQQVTGGTGFIGSHICVVLLEQGYNVVIVDNLSNSSPKVLERIQTICFGCANAVLLTQELRLI